MKKINISKLEPRKIAEIEHSRKRRLILQGSERKSDSRDAPENLDELIKNKENFEYHFSNQKFYSVTEASEAYQQDWILKNCSSFTSVLDFACGNGENGIACASMGANVTGIDISPEGVINANLNAKASGVSSNCHFEVMDGEAMTFGDNSFDLAIEYGALHHVDLEVTLKELARVLKPDSKMLCIEALRHNPLIHWYRKRTPHLRTEWEVNHILGIESLDLMNKYFYNVDVKFFHLSSLILVPIRKSFLFPLLLPFFNFIDKILLSNKIIGKYGWIMIVELSKPIK